MFNSFPLAQFSCHCTHNRTGKALLCPIDRGPPLKAGSGSRLTPMVGGREEVTVVPSFVWYVLKVQSCANMIVSGRE